ncbi:MAG: mandelate racemase/muconate lactonizing enzyme family protein [Acidobacteria bacterium]|nr:mandelate racemase/muconate lactonizing enzyme family protein [Acidobacteriota bacterium]MCI0718891.1 mandelate racemase/muconate lactonizing enzyme family protein [Acidobacteriota bacterium]
MKITSIKTHLCHNAGHRYWIFTEIHTDEGITGVSEVGMNQEKTVATAIGSLAEYLLGKDPTRIEEHFEKLYRTGYWVGTIRCTAISAVEMALWDILGKSLGVPVYRLLGGPTRDQIAVYAHVVPEGEGTRSQKLAQGAKLMVERGYRAVKMDPFGRDYRRGVSDPHFPPYIKETEHFPNQVIDLACQDVGAVREAVGPNVDIMVDFHGKLSPANAIRLGETLEQFRLLFIEDPVPPENVDGLVLVSRALSTPVCAGERLVTVYGFRELLNKQAVAVINPDVTNVGGISEARKVAAMAKASYITVAPHNPNGPLATAASVHLAASIPNFLMLERRGLIEDVARADEVGSPPLQMQDGKLLLPTGPGWGVELNAEALARYANQEFSSEPL